MPVKDVDRGYAKMIANLDATGKIAITVGIHSEEGAGEDGGFARLELVFP